MHSIHDLTPEQRTMFEGLATKYSSFCLVDLVNGEFEIIKTEKSIRDYYKNNPEPDCTFCRYFLPFITVQNHQMLCEYTDYKSVADKLLHDDYTQTITVNSRLNIGVTCDMEWRIASRNGKGEATRAFFIVKKVNREETKFNKTLREVHDIVEAAWLGIYYIELFHNELPHLKGNDTMMRLIGMDTSMNYSEEEAYEVWFKGIPAESMPSVNASLQKMMQGKHDENTYKWIHPELGERYVRCGGVGQKIPGKGYIIMGYHTDVTDQVLREKENSLVVNALADTYRCLYYIDIKSHSYTSYVTNGSLFSKDIPSAGDFDAIRKLFWHNLAKEDFEEKVKDFLDLNTLNNRFAYKNRLTQQFLDNEDKWNELKIIVCDRDSKGNVSHFILGLNDIDTQKQVEARIHNELKKSKEAITLRTTLLQNMSHEIRTPLNAMFGFSQLLSQPEGFISDKEKDEYINYIHNSFNMLSMLIDDILDVSDDEHGQFRINKTQVAVNEICRSSLQIADIRCPDKVRLYFTTELDDSYSIVSDGRRIQQVLINYLTNACKHTSDGEIHLHLSKTENPGHLTFSVTDTGSGVPPEMAQDIFERFKKLDNMVQGSGLGLNICNVIAENLNGSVKLDTSYTGGARFLFIL